MFNYATQWLCIDVMDEAYINRLSIYDAFVR